MIDAIAAAFERQIGWRDRMHMEVMRVLQIADLDPGKSMRVIPSNSLRIGRVAVSDSQGDTGRP